MKITALSLAWPPLAGAAIESHAIGAPTCSRLRTLPGIGETAGLSATQSRLKVGAPGLRSRYALSVVLFLLASHASAMVRYVDVNCTNSASPYTNWAGAATTIQQAVDAAVPGDVVLVTNGTYQTGARAVYGSMSNRVVITKAITVQSVNGPAATAIRGYQAPGTLTGSKAVRCVYLTNGATLAGFTLLQGATHSSGDPTREQSGGGVWCESASAVVSNCVVSANAAQDGGGGGYHGTFINCTLSTNSAFNGGGAYAATLSGCSLSGNSAEVGGGVFGGSVQGCTLSSNSAYQDGGGAAQSTLDHCVLGGNTAGWYGGGARFSALKTCVLSGNSSGFSAGGAYGCTLFNSTLTGNRASLFGGGVVGGQLTNCIVYYNSASTGANYDLGNYDAGWTLLSYCCTTPLPTNGTANLTAEPQLADSAHLSAGSPCLGAGNPAAAVGLDIDGEPWATSPAIGCDEYHAGGVAGPLSVTIQARYTEVAVGFVVEFSGTISGRASSSRWEFGDGTVVSNRPFQVFHSWTAPADYPVTLRAYNDSNPAGVSATVTVHVFGQPIHYVAADSAAPEAPYSSWEKAATTIQDAVDEASLPGSLVLVTNGTYATGWGMKEGALNRVVVDRSVLVQSVNGPAVTIIDGGMETRCAYLANGSGLQGFTLTSGTAPSGGGVCCQSDSAVLFNCVLAGNQADNGGAAYGGTLESCILTGNSSLYSGGGAYRATLNNCTVVGNSAQSAGGGVAQATLRSCTLTNNTANLGGGADQCTLTNCLLTSNLATTSGGGAISSTLKNCILTGNQAGTFGGGVVQSVLNNCSLVANHATLSGGGAAASSAPCAELGSCALNNCTLVGNSAGSYGGGACGCGLYNCILYYNSGRAETWSAMEHYQLTDSGMIWDPAGGGPGVWDEYASGWVSTNAHPASTNWAEHFFSGSHDSGNYTTGCNLDHCTTTPLPLAGAGNLSDEPLLTDSCHLSTTSPCRGAGSAAYATGVDIDGEQWTNPPSIGCDQYHGGSAAGPLRVTIPASQTTVAAGFGLPLLPVIMGHASGCWWDLGNGTVLSNRPYASPSWTSPGTYSVILHAYNDTHPGGITATVTVHVVEQPVHYVAQSSTNPVAPYSSWATAATNIQSAVNAASVPGAVVLVSNGVYDAGATVIADTTNRLAVTKPALVRSVNGPAVTIIDGRSAMRCVYLTNGAALAGFTLTNGAAPDGGGVWGESASALVAGCELAGNSALDRGGGAYQASLIGSRLTGNRASRGGGAYYSALSGCTVVHNSAAASGGGACGGTANDCALSRNFAGVGGGAAGATLNNCAVTGNSANSSGGVFQCALNNCTVACNSANSVGGAGQSLLNNCIVYANSGGSASNYVGGALNFCCTAPMPTNGTGNITADPQLADRCHITAGSPCRATGSTNYAAGLDIDAESWATAPSIGCDEHYSGSITGALSAAIQASYTNVATEFLVNFTAQIGGHATSNRWEFGDGATANNQPFGVSHSWAAEGNYPVVLRVYNESYPAGVSATSMVYVLQQPIHCVRLDSASPVAPYTSWATAATNLQVAVDAAYAGGTVLVTNGVYLLGGRAVSGGLSNRVVVTRPISIRSVNGPAVTVIQGYQTTNVFGPGAVRCVYLASGSALAGFTLTNGATLDSGDPDRETSGGGLWCESASAAVSNCVLRGNSAYANGGGAWNGTLNDSTLAGNAAGCYGGGSYNCALNGCTVSNNSAAAFGGGACQGTLIRCTLSGNSAQTGGGAWNSMLSTCLVTDNSAINGAGVSSGTLNNCAVRGNSAGQYGGGADSSTLNNCTVTGNSAQESSGGVAGGEINNSIVYYNSAPFGTNYEPGWTLLNYCCTTPLPTNGVGNIASEPLFVDLFSGDLHLQAGSPCINAGDNLLAVGAWDLEGSPRMSGGRVDMGAYEFQSATPPPPTILVGEGTLGFGTNGVFGFSFGGSAGQTVIVQCSTNLVNWVALATNTLGASPLNFSDLGSTNSPQRYYRLLAP
jgi:PKD repeat protein